MSTQDQNDGTPENSSSPEQNDNLGAEDAKGTPPTVPPAGRGHDVDAESDDQTA